jgi:hypothetical protein
LINSSRPTKTDSTRHLESKSRPQNPKGGRQTVKTRAATLKTFRFPDTESVLTEIRRRRAAKHQRNRVRRPNALRMGKALLRHPRNPGSPRLQRMPFDITSHRTKWNASSLISNRPFGSWSHCSTARSCGCAISLAKASRTSPTSRRAHFFP